MQVCICVYECVCVFVCVCMIECVLCVSVYDCVCVCVYVHVNVLVLGTPGRTLSWATMVAELFGQGDGLLVELISQRTDVSNS